MIIGYKSLYGQMAGTWRHAAHVRRVAASVAYSWQPISRERSHHPLPSFLIYINLPTGIHKTGRLINQEGVYDAILQGEDKQHGQRGQGAHHHLQGQSSGEGMLIFSLDYNLRSIVRERLGKCEGKYIYKDGLVVMEYCRQRKQWRGQRRRKR